MTSHDNAFCPFCCASRRTPRSDRRGRELVSRTAFVRELLLSLPRDKNPLPGQQRSGFLGEADAAGLDVAGGDAPGLGILHEPTLPYSPYQNAKQESFRGTLEGRLMAMLKGVQELTLERLNTIAQA
jgi:hypothetical protein